MKKIMRSTTFILSFIFSITIFCQNGYAATFNVDRSEDLPDANLDDGLCDVDLGADGVQCTLRAAVQQANALDGQDTITIRPTTYLLTIAGKNEDMAATGDLDITDNVIIQGYGTTIDAAQIDRIFHIIGAIDVTLNGVVLENGETDVGEDGGAIFNSSNANTRLEESVVRNNTADQWGGGIANDSSAKIIIEDVVIIGNRAGSLGGGVDNHDGTMEIRESHILSNTATEKSGGGIYNDGQLTIEDSWIAYNEATLDGGGVFNFDTLFIKETTISTNVTGGNAGGLFNYGEEMIVENVTLAENIAGGIGGGLYNLGTADITNVTIGANTAISAGGFFNDGFANMANTIIAENIGGNCERFHVIDSLGHNLEDGNSCVFDPTLGDIVNGVAGLAQLSDNGGLAPTMALLPNSDALSAGDLDLCPTTDERGVSRPQGNGCEIGAFEEASADISIAKQVVNTGLIYAGETIQYEIVVQNSGENEAASVMVTHTLPTGTTLATQPEGTNWMCEENGGVVVCEYAVVAVNALSEPLTIMVTTPAMGGTVTSSAVVESVVPDSDLTNNSVTIDTEIVLASDLGVEVVANPAQVNVGDELTFTVNVSNAGPSTADVVTMTIALPSEDVTYSTAGGAGWACDFVNGEIVCTADMLTVGTHPIDVTVVAVKGNIEVMSPVDVAAGTHDPNSTNNATEATLGNTLASFVDLAISTTVTPTQIVAGQRFTYSLNVVNGSDVTAAQINVTHELPADVTYVDFVGEGWTCTFADNVVTCERDVLAGSHSAPLQIVVTAPDEEMSLTTSTALSSGTNEINDSDNSDSLRVDVVSAADLSIVGYVSVEPNQTVHPGDELIYTIQVKNLGASTALSSLFTLTLPADTSYMRFSGEEWLCASSGDVVICQRPVFEPSENLQSITIRATVDVTTTVTGDLSIVSQTYDTDITNNTANLAPESPTNITLSSYLSAEQPTYIALIGLIIGLYTVGVYIVIRRRSIFA